VLTELADKDFTNRVCQSGSKVPLQCIPENATYKVWDFHTDSFPCQSFATAIALPCANYKVRCIYGNVNESFSSGFIYISTGQSSNEGVWTIWVSKGWKHKYNTSHRHNLTTGMPHSYVALESVPEQICQLRTHVHVI